MSYLAPQQVALDTGNGVTLRSVAMRAPISNTRWNQWLTVPGTSLGWVPAKLDAALVTAGQASGLRPQFTTGGGPTPGPTKGQFWPR